MSHAYKAGQRLAGSVVYELPIGVLLPSEKGHEGTLLDRQKHMANQAHVIVNASAKAGIKGLVYALAGYSLPPKQS